MKKLANAIKKIFLVKYRVSILYKGDTEPTHAYYLKLKLARGLAKAAGNVPYWTIYRTGPFFLPEREIERWYGGEQ